VVGALAIVALLFLVGGVGFALGRTNTADLEATTIHVVQEVGPSVVEVQAKRNGPLGSVGSGEILTSNGYIVTNSHVVHGATTFDVVLSNGQTMPAQLVGDVPQQDLAVLKVAGSNMPAIAVADSSQAQVGEYVIAMGSPLGLEQSATSGIVSALDREGTEKVDGNTYTLKGMIQTSAPINPGNSGGALVNSHGQLLGVPTLSAVDPHSGGSANGIGFAIAANQMKAVVAPFIPSGS
jgi:S1-C subfamily serine protease